MGLAIPMWAKPPLRHHLAAIRPPRGPGDYIVSQAQAGGTEVWGEGRGNEAAPSPIVVVVVVVRDALSTGGSGDA